MSTYPVLQSPLAKVKYAQLPGVFADIRILPVLDYTDGDKVALDVGFYYMANAGGRLVGCLLSGVLFEVAGLAGCLWGTFAFALLAALIALRLPRRALHPELLAHAGIKAGDSD